jgi:hypothetical protein
MQQKSHTWVYVVIAVVIVGLMVAGVVGFKQKKDTAEARAKATELIAKLDAAGFKTPDADVVVALFGTDGGVAVANPANALLQAQFAMQLSNAGAAGRPGILDQDLFKAEVIILEVYAPEKLAAYRAWLDSLEFGDTK